jgi:hypothetical protein
MLHPAAVNKRARLPSKEIPVLSPRILVADLLDYSPLLVPLLLELRVDCVGCSMNKYCTLEELCAQYKLDLESILSRIQEILNNHAD